MLEDEFYFCGIEPGVALVDYGRINDSLLRLDASFRYGPALDKKGKPLWIEEGTDVPCNGIYRRKDSFKDPQQAQITLAEAYQREAKARRFSPLLCPQEPKLPDRYAVS